MKPGGTDGGSAIFLGGVGLVLSAVGLYLFLDSVRVSSDGAGWISGYLRGAGGGDTASMGALFVPFLTGIVILFYDARLKLGWGFLIGGLAIIMIEILSRLRFVFDMKTSHLVLILGMIFAGLGMMLRSFRDGAGGDE